MAEMTKNEMIKQEERGEKNAPFCEWERQRATGRVEQNKEEDEELGEEKEGKNKGKLRG